MSICVSSYDILYIIRYLKRQHEFQAANCWSDQGCSRFPSVACGGPSRGKAALGVATIRRTLNWTDDETSMTAANDLAVRRVSGSRWRGVHRGEWRRPRRAPAKAITRKIAEMRKNAAGRSSLFEAWQRKHYSLDLPDPVEAGSCRERSARNCRTASLQRSIRAAKMPSTSSFVRRARM